MNHIFSIFIMILFCQESFLKEARVKEELSGLTAVTTNEQVSRDANGGDFGSNLVYVLSDGKGAYNLFMKESIRSDSARQKTFGQNVNLAPNYCAANDRIVFQYFDRNNFDLSYIETAGKWDKSVVKLTNTSQNEYNPSWSKDGAFITFEKGVAPRGFYPKNLSNPKMIYPGARVAQNQICILDVATHEVRIVGEGSFPKFSPDGKSLVFVKYFLNNTQTHETGAIWIMGTDGSSPREIVGTKEGYASRPDWSPDGKKIIFELTRGRQSRANIYTVDVAGENMIQQTSDESNNFAPYWSAENNVYFTSDRGNKPGRYRIWSFQIKSK